MTKRLTRRDIFKTKLFTIKDVDLQYKNGKIKTHQIIEKPDVSIIVPLTKDGQILFVREYSTAHDEYRLDLPGGKIEPDDTPSDTAIKELQEEIGYKPGKLDELGMLTISPGYITQKSHIFLARELVKSKLEGDEEEELEIVEYPFEKFEELIESGELNEARAIAALYLARKFLKHP